MNQNQRDRRNFFQNILITLLSLSAVLLFIATQINNREVLFSPLPENNVSSGNSREENSSLAAPVRVAVSGSYGRFGSIALSTASEEFSPLGSLLEEALNTAQSFNPCSREDFFSALENPSIYYDFLAPLPLSVLGSLVGADGEDSVSARYLVVSSPSGAAPVLHLWDNEDLYFSCSTALSNEDLDALISGYEQGNALFAFDSGETYETYTKTLHPLSLFLPDVHSALPTATAASSLSGSSELLSALSFNPHTQTRWTEGNGTEVIVDGDRTLRLYADGILSYRGGGNNDLSISSGEFPSLTEVIRETKNLLYSLLPRNSEAELYLTSVSRSGSSVSLTFEYHLSGIPIRFSNGTPAAKVTLSGSTVSSIFMTCREYRTEEETAMLLPVLQALAIAAKQPGAELMIGYADYGTATVTPRWLCE